MNDLISWLRQQTDLDEQALLRRREGHLYCLNVEGQSPEDYTPYDSCYLHIQEAEATPYRDVEFGLRQVQAHRAILDLHDPAHDPCDAHDASLRTVPCETLLALVSIYSDRDGYRTERST